MRYIIEKDGAAVKEYKRKGNALNYARELANKCRYQEYKPLIILHEFDGSKGSVVWSNRPIA